MGNINAMQKLIDLANRIKNESLETSILQKPEFLNHEF